MGCGMSTIDPEEATDRSNTENKRPHGHNVHDNSPMHSERILENARKDNEADYFCTGRKSSVVCYPAVDKGYGIARVERDDNGDHEEGGDGETFHDGQDNIGGGPGSPSFREYCVDSNGFGLNEAKNCETVHAAAQERPLICEKVEGSKSAEPNKKSTRKRFKSAIPMRGWIGKSRKSI